MQTVMMPAVCVRLGILVPDDDGAEDGDEDGQTDDGQGHRDPALQERLDQKAEGDGNRRIRWPRRSTR